jgi:hypothetical protein
MVERCGVVTSPRVRLAITLGALLAAPPELMRLFVSNLAAVREPPFPFTTRVSARVELALEAAFRRHDAAIAELRFAIEACVRELQQQGMLPEAMVVTMRAYIQHTASHPSADHPTASRVASLLIDEIIRWSILAYYPSTILPAQRHRVEES